MLRSWALHRPFRAPPFVTTLADRDGVVGRHFFRDLAREAGGELRAGESNIGIVPCVDAMRSSHFEPSRLHPRVRDVWERTTALEFDAVELRPSSWSRPFWPLYRWIGRSMRQIEVPDPAALPSEIRSHVSVMDLDRDGRTDYRVWVRTVHDDVYYVAAVFTHKCDGPGGEESYLDAILPIWRSNLALVFQPSNLADGGLRASTRARGSRHAGSYLIVPRRDRYWMMPFFGLHEEISVVPRTQDPDTVLDATHVTTWFGFRSFTLRYELREKTGAGNPIRRTCVRSKELAKSA
jgi:hypothetical protein